LNFPAYDPIVTNAASPLNATPTTMSVACTNGVNPGITIPAGVHLMNGGIPAGTLDYQLFADAGYSVPFATSLPGTLMGVAPSKAPRNLDIYGQIPAGRDPSVGSYTGTLLVTVNF
ncbi:MAG TPA: spore coat protein U domain-containing protein, partial [Thermoanaerobaculia bacterium]|nr:spore coat protein U domain-containing protein [Thermoanaerobaculia bacterium]